MVIPRISVGFKSNVSRNYQRTPGTSPCISPVAVEFSKAEFLERAKAESKQIRNCFDAPAGERRFSCRLGAIRIHVAIITCRMGRSSPLSCSPKSRAGAHSRSVGGVARRRVGFASRRVSEATGRSSDATVKLSWRGGVGAWRRARFHTEAQEKAPAGAGAGRGKVTGRQTRRRRASRPMPRRTGVDGSGTDVLDRPSGCQVLLDRNFSKLCEGRCKSRWPDRRAGGVKDSSA